MSARERRVEALVDFLGELLGGGATTRRGALKLLVEVYARHCLEPLVGVSTRGAFERELALAHALAERGLGLGEELEELAEVFWVERKCEKALDALLAGADPAEALESSGAVLSESWVRALLGYARALHHLGYVSDEELASILKAVERTGVGAHALRFTRKLVAAHKLAQQIASGQLTSRGRKERSERVLALLYGGGSEDKPPDALVWQVAVNVYGVSERAVLRLLKVKKNQLEKIAVSSASWWYRGVASLSEIEKALSQLDKPWLRAYRDAVKQLSGLTPAASPIALALLEQAALESLDPEGFLEKLSRVLGSEGSLVERLLAWDASGWSASLLPLPGYAFEVRLLRGHEMVIVGRVHAWEVLEAGVRGLCEKLRARMEVAVSEARLEGRASPKWLRLVSMLLALRILSTACELSPTLGRHPIVLAVERAEVGGVKLSAELMVERWKKYLVLRVSGREVARLRVGDPGKTEAKAARVIKNLPRDVSPEVRVKLRELAERLIARRGGAGNQPQQPA